MLTKPILDTDLDWMKSGRQRYEGRLGNKRQEWSLHLGQQIKFYDNEDSYVIVEVTALRDYSDFGAAYDELGAALVPDSDRSAAVSLYNKLFHYENEDLDELWFADQPTRMIMDHGVVAIGFRVLHQQ